MNILNQLNKSIENELKEKSDIIINEKVNDFRICLINERDNLIPKLMRTIVFIHKENMVGDSFEIIIKREVL